MNAYAVVVKCPRSRSEWYAVADASGHYIEGLPGEPLDVVRIRYLAVRDEPDGWREISGPIQPVAVPYLEEICFKLDMHHERERVRMLNEKLGRAGAPARLKIVTRRRSKSAI